MNMAASYGIDGGGDAGALQACIMNMCSAEVDACMTMTCQQCGGAVGNCALQNCVLSGIDASLPHFDGAAPKDGCASPGPECAALATCCSEISTAAALFSALQTYATMCTTNSQSCDEATCKGTITAVNSLGASFGMSMLCKGPDGG
jgi:hypothetical protein